MTPIKEILQTINQQSNVGDELFNKNSSEGEQLNATTENISTNANQKSSESEQEDVLVHVQQKDSTAAITN